MDDFFQMEVEKSLFKATIRVDRICLICGDKARGMNFDVITCMSCKAFFRRNALRRSKVLLCQLDGNCVINQQTRGGCSACRLKKCFALGMNTDLIRSPYENRSKQRKKVVNLEANLCLPQPQPISLLNHDRSNLSFDEWNLLSNIIHVYDEQNLALRTQFTLQKQVSLPLKVRSKASYTLELIGSFYTAVQPLIERTSYFRALSSDARRLIVQKNMCGSGTFNAMIAAIEGNVYDSEAHITVCNEIYGTEYVAESYRVLQRLESNRTLLKIMLMILLFASNSSIVIYDPLMFAQLFEQSVTQTIQLLRIQDVLVTMIWKYMTYQYGFTEAVRRFSLVVKNFLDTLNRMNDNTSGQHWQMVDVIVDQMNETLIVAD